MADPPDGTVIPFPGRYRAPETPTEGIPAQTLQRGFLRGPCGILPRHAAVVDVRARRVQCARCKADLDAFEVLGDVAQHFEQHNFLIAENAKLAKQKAEFEAEVRKLREARNGLRRRAEKRGDP